MPELPGQTPPSKVNEVQAGRSMVPDLSLEPVTSASPGTLLEMQNRCLPSLTYRIRICFSDKIPRWFKWEVCQARAVLGPSPPTGVSLELFNVPLNATSSPCLPWLCLSLPDIIWFHPLLGKRARLWLHSTVFYTYRHASLCLLSLLKAGPVHLSLLPRHSLSTVTCTQPANGGSQSH